MAIFIVYPDGNRDAAQRVPANMARRAAEAYWQRRVCRGNVRANEEERIVVEHTDGPKVDTSVMWHIEGGRMFALFDVCVVSVDVSAAEAK